MANGLYSNVELIDSIIKDLNEYLKAQATGQLLQGTAVMAGIAQRLVNLRQHVDDDLKNRDETIESLKAQLRAHGMEVVEVPVDSEEGNE